MAHSEGRSLVLMCYVAMCYVLCCSHMPRLPTLRTRVLQELARQLRFESADAARRQLARAEDLALQLLDESVKPDAPAAYPEEWVVFRVTGLRMEARGGDGGVVVREALLGDLPALIDRLSAAGKITESDLRGTGKRTSKDGTTGGRAASAQRATTSIQADAVWLSVAELCARWKVSRKTLERYRRVGLVSRRITLGRGREKVVYSEACVRMFERVHRERVEEAGDFARLDSRTRERLVRRAARYRARLGWTLHKCAQRLAAREGRSVEGVRQLLRGYNDRAERPIFDEPGVLDAEGRAWVERTSKRGGSMSGAASRVRKGRTTVYRVVGARRADRLRGLELRGPVGPMFERKDGAEVLLGSAPAREGLGGRGAASVGELLRIAATIEPGGALFERGRAGACWYLIWRARLGVAGLARHAARVRKAKTNEPGIDEIETGLLWASRLKAEMVRAQVPLLVRAIENQTGRAAAAIPGGALKELCEIGLGALIDATDRFDPFKGGRLAAPVGIALTRAVSQWLRRSGDALGPPGRAIARVDLDALPLADWTRRVYPWQEWLELPPGVRERVGELGERERRVVEMRFGLGGPPCTLEDAGAGLGTTPTRIAAMQRKAVALLAYGPPVRAKREKRGGAR